MANGLTEEEREILMYWRGYNYGIAELTHIIIEHRNKGLWDFIMSEVHEFLKKGEEDGRSEHKNLWTRVE